MSTFQVFMGIYSARRRWRSSRTMVGMDSWWWWLRLGRSLANLWLTGTLPSRMSWPVQMFPIVYRSVYKGVKCNSHVYDLWPGIPSRKCNLHPGRVLFDPQSSKSFENMGMSTCIVAPTSKGQIGLSETNRSITFLELSLLSSCIDNLQVGSYCSGGFDGNRLKKNKI